MIELIKKRIEQLGLQKKHVAKRIGISPAQFSQYLSENRNMPIEIETKLKNYLGL